MFRKFFLIFTILLLPSFAKAEDLLDVVKISFDNSYEYKAKVESYNSNQMYSSIARSYILPTLSFSGSINATNNKRDYTSSGVHLKTKITPLNLSLTLVQPLYNKNAWTGYSKANLLADQGAIQLDIDRNAIILKTVQYYLDVLSSLDDLEFINTQKKHLEEQLEETKKRISVGQARVIDIEEVKAKYEAVKSQELLYKNNLQLASSNLNIFLNHNVSSYKKIKDSLDDMKIEESPMEAWIEQAHKGNLDILQAHLSLLIANEDVTISSSSYYPAVNLIGSVGYNISKDPSMSMEKYKERIASIGVSVSMDLYSGGSTSASKKQAVYNKRSLEYQNKALDSNIYNIVSGYYLNVYNGLAQISALNQASLSSLKFLEASKKSYAVGLKTNTDVLIATETYFDNKRNLSKSKYQFLLSILSLKASVGVLTLDDIAEINNYFE